MSQWSLAATLDALDAFPPHVVMQEVAAMYDRGNRGLFSEKFIPMMDMQMLGYQGFRRAIQAIYEINPQFIEDNKMELIELTRALYQRRKGEQDNG